MLVMYVCFMLSFKRTVQQIPVSARKTDIHVHVLANTTLFQQGVAHYKLTHAYMYINSTKLQCTCMTSAL